MPIKPLPPMTTLTTKQECSYMVDLKNTPTRKLQHLRNVQILLY